MHSAMLITNMEGRGPEQAQHHAEVCVVAWLFGVLAILFWGADPLTPARYGRYLWGVVKWDHVPLKDRTAVEENIFLPP